MEAPLYVIPSAARDLLFSERKGVQPPTLGNPLGLGKNFRCEGSLSGEGNLTPARTEGPGAIAIRAFARKPARFHHGCEVPEKGHGAALPTRTPVLLQYSR